MADPIIHEQPLPYVAQLERRRIDGIDLVVLHCTELPDLASARHYGERVLYPSGAGNSGHYYIDRDGTTLRYVPIDCIAHHVRGYNHRSIGIELVNRGRYPHWWDSRHQSMDEGYPAAQIIALRQLLGFLQRRHPGLRLIAGHEDLDREMVAASDDPSVQLPRKRDPGPRFDWTQVLADGLWQRLQPSV